MINCVLYVPCQFEPYHCMIGFTTGRQNLSTFSIPALAFQFIPRSNLVRGLDTVFQIHVLIVRLIAL